MKKIPKLMLFTFTILIFACSPASSSTPKDVQDPESAFLSLLMESSDIRVYNCEWIADFVRQTSDPNSLQAKGADEAASRVLSGTCVSYGEFSSHITLRHELYLYKTSKPREISSYLVTLSEDAEWRNFDLEIEPIYESVSKCETYKAGEYQDCFFILKYDQIVSVVWINSSKELQDAQLRLIAIDVIDGVEKRILDFIKEQ